jgi:AhpD family alkylhydroperoxidase
MVMQTVREANEVRLKYLKKLNDELPEVVAHEKKKWEAVYRDGALSSKIKRLMALAIALRAGCENCIIAQTMRALEEGASKQEIMETISVNMSMSGTTGIAESLRVLRLLDELGEL